MEGEGELISGELTLLPHSPNKTFAIQKKQKDFLVYYEKFRGLKTRACEAARISEVTFRKWYEAEEWFRKACDEINDTQFFYVENKLFEKIEEGDTTAILFYIKLKGQPHGYSSDGMNGEKRQYQPTFMVNILPVKDADIIP